MAKSRWLESARDACARREQQLALAVAECKRQVQEGASKLTELERYHAVYRRDFQQRVQVGMSAERVRTFQVFLGRLELAITEQREVLARSRAQESEELRKWRGAARRSAALERLIERHRQAAQRRSLQVEQATSDAHAQRAWVLKGTRRGH
jgi:flagellar protein FliJ